MNKLFDWIYNKYLDWKLRQLYPNGISKEALQEAKRILLRK